MSTKVNEVMKESIIDAVSKSDPAKSGRIIRLIYVFVTGLLED